jgi:hypothetical protein
MQTTTVHKHFQFGTAPFRFVAVWSAPSKSLQEANPEAYNAQMRSKPEFCHFSCDHCGTCINNHCIIVDATGAKFCVGTDCVLKTTHTEVVSKVKLALKQKAKAVREAKRQAEQQARQAAYDAELQAQRDANGGLTDDQVAYKKAYEARKEQLARTNAIVAPVVSVLDAAGGDFCFSIAQGYRNGLLPQGRAKDIVIEIVAKQAGKKGSKAYEAALNGAQELVESIEIAIKQNYRG